MEPRRSGLFWRTVTSSIHQNLESNRHRVSAWYLTPDGKKTKKDYTLMSWTLKRRTLFKYEKERKKNLQTYSTSNHRNSEQSTKYRMPLSHSYSNTPYWLHWCLSRIGCSRIFSVATGYVRQARVWTSQWNMKNPQGESPWVYMDPVNLATYSVAEPCC